MTRNEQLYRSRALALFSYLFIVLVFFLLVVRLFRIQVGQHHFFLSKAEGQVLRVDRPVGRRGRILDASGEALTFSVRAPRLMAHPHLIGGEEKRREVAKVLSRILDVPDAELVRRLSIDSPCVILKTKVYPSTKVDLVNRWLASSGVRGLRFEEDEWRVYPNAELATHAIGFVGDNNRGLAGLELEYDEVLAGREGFVPYECDGLANRIDSLRLNARPAIKGCDIILSLDRTIQHGLEQALDELIEEHKPDGAVGIVLCPKTGGILALANRPTFERVAPGKAPPSSRRNRAVTDPYEPGSTIKPFVLNAALEFGAVEFASVIDCEGGRKRFGSRLVKDTKTNDRLSIEDVLVRSSNVGMAKLGLRVGCGPMFDSFCRMTMASRTGVDLPGEAKVLLTPREKWTENYTLVSVSFGYEIAFTPIKLAGLYAGIANRGWMMTPHFVEAVVAPPESDPETLETIRRKIDWHQRGCRIMPAENAEDLRAVLRRVVLEGTGKRADVPGFKVAGKSGTSQRWIRGKKDGHNSSFVAFAPYDNPKVVVLVVAYGPTGGAYYGGKVAAPAVKKTLECARARLEIVGDFEILNTSVSTAASNRSVAESVRLLASRRLSE